jgi:hypothetical protein
MTKSAESAMECPRIQNQTVIEHGLSYPPNVKRFASAIINGSFLLIPTKAEDALWTRLSGLSLGNSG